MEGAGVEPEPASVAVDYLGMNDVQSRNAAGASVRPDRWRAIAMDDVQASARTWTEMPALTLSGGASAVACHAGSRVGVLLTWMAGSDSYFAFGPGLVDEALNESGNLSTVPADARSRPNVLLARDPCWGRAVAAQSLVRRPLLGPGGAIVRGAWSGSRGWASAAGTRHLCSPANRCAVFGQRTGRRRSSGR